MTSFGNSRLRQRSDIPVASKDARRLRRTSSGSGGAVENFRFSDIRIYPLADPDGAVGEVRAEGRIKATGREYRQEYAFFLRAADGKIASLREYFDPTRAAKAMDRQII